MVGVCVLGSFIGTLAQSKIEFTSHLIKISTQITTGFMGFGWNVIKRVRSGRYCMGTTLLFWLLHMPIVITGGRTSLFLTSQRMPSRYGCVCEFIQLYKWNNYIYVNGIINVIINGIIYVYTYGHTVDCMLL